MVKYFLLFGTLAHAVENQKYMPRRLTQNFGAKKILLSEFCARRKGCRQIHVERVSDLVGLAARTLHKIDQITPAQGLPEIHKKYQYFSRTNMKI